MQTGQPVHHDVEGRLHLRSRQQLAEYTRQLDGSYLKTWGMKIKQWQALYTLDPAGYENMFI